MIDTLHIQHFLSFENLLIPKLGRVNLIAGKNNVGKTALLEALRIYTARGEESVINHIVETRVSFHTGWVENYDFLFNRAYLEKPDLASQQSGLVINDLEITRVVKRGGGYNYVVAMDDGPSFPIEAQKQSTNPKDRAIFIPFQSNFDKLAAFWDKIVLTPKEDDVIGIIRNSIEPKLIRFDVGQNGVKIRLDGVTAPLPLSTLGDGMQRILLIALSLANAQNGTLLIDEIESGLHYTVLEKLWEMVFKYAKEWNIQVFATTHSQDAIKAFHYIASQETYNDDAEFIRLQQSRKGSIEAIIYDGKQLEDLLNLNLEIR